MAKAAKSTKDFELFERRNPGTGTVSVRLSSRRSHRKFKSRRDGCQARLIRARTYEFSFHPAITREAASTSGKPDTPLPFR
ncbi:MAG: hypothetical protein RIS36_1975 [Pseudomonadota bacterium]|jgi:hypothetical protein